jgi:galactofuranose transport system permease protein
MAVPFEASVMKIRAEKLPLAVTGLVLVVLYCGGALSFENFGSPRVVINLLGDNAFIGIGAVGATFVILASGIDLSVGAVIAFTGILIAKLTGAGVPPLAAIGIAVLIGATFGAGQGYLIHAFALPPFSVTLAGMFLMRGLAFLVHPQSLPVEGDFFANVLPDRARIPVGGGLALPFTALSFLAAVGIAWVVARFTGFGRNVYALGSNERSAESMGVPIGGMKVAIYMLAGIFSALAGVVATAYMQSGNPASFVGLELDVIAAVVIGGALLTGGTGSVLGTFAGVLILGLVQAIITFQGTLNSWWTRIAIGALLLVFIGLQRALSSSGTGAPAGR